MMLDFLGRETAAARVEAAMRSALTSGEIRSLSTNSGMRTSQYTDVVLKHLK
jgi:isocitrate/isopropylmalate dehydrogenase